MSDLVQRLGDEADLCRNDGVPEVGSLIDEAAARIEQLESLLKEARHYVEMCELGGDGRKNCLTRIDAAMKGE